MTANLSRVTQRSLSLFRQRGVSLIELMVSIAIGLFLLLGLSTLLFSNSQTSQELNKAGNQIENGRYALQVLTDDIHLAGFLGTSYAPLGVTWTTPDPCATALADLGFDNTTGAIKVPVAIYGYVDGAGLPTTCTAAITNRRAGTGILVVRRVSTNTVTAATGSDTFLQVSTCPDAIIDAVRFIIDTDTSKFTLSQNDCLSTKLAPLRKYMVRVYYVSDCNECGTDTIPTLKVAELKGGLMDSTTTVSLVEGIENLQLDYGIDMDNDGSVDCYTSNPTSPPGAEIAVAVCPDPTPSYSASWLVPLTNWSNVMAVRVNVLARNVDPSPGWSDSKTYTMGLAGGTVAAANDPYKRHVYSAVARLYNISGQREKP